MPAQGVLRAVDEGDGSGDHEALGKGAWHSRHHRRMAADDHWDGRRPALRDTDGAATRSFSPPPLADDEHLTSQRSL